MKRWLLCQGGVGEYKEKGVADSRCEHRKSWGEIYR